MTKVARFAFAATVSAAIAAISLPGVAAATPSAAPFEKATAIVQPSLAYVEIGWQAWVKDTKTGEVFGGTKGYSTTIRCSGFVVSPDGTIVTAGSCVDATVTGAVGQQFVGLAAEELVKVGRSASVQQAVTGLSASAQLVSSNDGELKPQVHVTMGQANGGVAAGGYDARIVRFLPRANGDIAVLKATAGRLAAVALATDDPSDSDVAAFGYPGDATAASAGPRGMVTGHVGGAATGTPASFDLGATATAGMVGGPVVDAAGEVVGLITGREPAAGAAELDNVAVPVSAIRKLLTDAESAPSLGPADRDFRIGLDAYFDGHYTKAIEAFDVVLVALPDHEMAQAYRAKAVELRDKEGDATDWVGLGTWIAAGVAFVVAVLLFVLAIRRLGKRRTAAKQAAAAYAMPMSGAPMSGMPVSGYPVSGYPVSAVPVSGYPVSAVPVSAYPAGPYSAPQQPQAYAVPQPPVMAGAPTPGGPVPQTAVSSGPGPQAAAPAGLGPQAPAPAGPGQTAAFAGPMSPAPPTGPGPQPTAATGPGPQAPAPAGPGPQTPAFASQGPQLGAPSGPGPQAPAGPGPEAAAPAGPGPQAATPTSAPPEPIASANPARCATCGADLELGAATCRICGMAV